MPRRVFRDDWRSVVFLSKGFLGAGSNSGKKVKTWSCCRTRLCSSWKTAIRLPSRSVPFSNCRVKTGKVLEAWFSAFL